MDGERGRWEVVNDSDVEEEAYGIDIVHGGSDESQNNYENRTRASVISSVDQWTECSTTFGHLIRATIGQR